MTAAKVQEINFGIYQDFDRESFECRCGLVYRVFPRAMGIDWPRGYACPVTFDRRGKYTLAGTMCALVPEDDDGKQLYRRVRWACPCGALCSYVEVMYSTVDCRACEKAAIRRSIHKPSDYYINPRWGMACGCCGHQGTHSVRRDGIDLPRCMA